MKIYHKKNFATGLLFTLLGAAFIVLFLVMGNIEPKSVVFCVLSLLLGPGLLLRSFDKRLSFQDRVDELDERNILVKLRTKSTAFSIVQYTLLGVCVLCAVGAIAYQRNPEGQLVLGGMLIVSGVVWFISLRLCGCCGWFQKQGLHYEKKL